MIEVACNALAKAQPLRREEEGWQGLVGLTDTQYASLATSRLWPGPSMGRSELARRQLWPPSHGKA